VDEGLPRLPRRAARGEVPRNRVLEALDDRRLAAPVPVKNEQKQSKKDNNMKR